MCTARSRRPFGIRIKRAASSWQTQRCSSTRRDGKSWDLTGWQAVHTFNVGSGKLARQVTLHVGQRPDVTVPTGVLFWACWFLEPAQAVWKGHTHTHSVSVLGSGASHKMAGTARYGETHCSPEFPGPQAFIPVSIALQRCMGACLDPHHRQQLSTVELSKGTLLG